MSGFTHIETHAAEIRALRRDPAVLRRNHQLARITAKVVGDLAPERTGHYVRSIFAARIGGADPHSVVGVRDFKAWWIEFGTVRPWSGTPAYAPLRRALTALRIRFTQTVKR